MEISKKMNRIFDNGSTTGGDWLFTCQTATTGSPINWTYHFNVDTTDNSKQPVKKYCLYCEKASKIICEKGACKKCHGENMCHGELRD